MLAASTLAATAWDLFAQPELVAAAKSEFDKRMATVYAEPDESKRQLLVKIMTRDIVEKAPYIWLPIPYMYTAWWPWVKNYAGELRVGAERPGPIHARMWVDQEMKKKLGF